MSLTHSRGLTDAGRWTAVATTLADHLDALDSANGASVPPPPAGAVEAARRFFNFVLTGIAIDQKRSAVSNIAEPHPRSQTAAAGISNLSIAVRVIRSEKPSAFIDDLGQVEKDIKSLLSSLEQLRAPNRRLSSTARKSLLKFLRELQRQGEIERDAAVAAQERPRDYRNLVR